MSISTVYSCGFFLLSLFKCTPIQYFWTRWLGANEECMEQSSLANVAYVFAGVGAFTDWSLALLPIWLLWSEDLNRRTRNTIRLLMFVGLVPDLASLSRISTTQVLLTTDDFFYVCVPLAVSSILEITLGILLISAASFRPLCTGFYGNPIQLSCNTPLSTDEKRPVKENRYSDIVSQTGVQMSTPVAPAVFRKVSEERTRDTV